MLSVQLIPGGVGVGSSIGFNCSTKLLKQIRFEIISSHKRISYIIETCQNYLGPFGILWIHYGLIQKIVLKMA